MSARPAMRSTLSAAPARSAFRAPRVQLRSRFLVRVTPQVRSGHSPPLAASACSGARTRFRQRIACVIIEYFEAVNVRAEVLTLSSKAIITHVSSIRAKDTAQCVFSHLYTLREERIDTPPHHPPNLS